MSAALKLFTEKHGEYTRFIRLMLYPQGIRAFFQRCRLLGAGQRILDAGCGAGVVALALRQAMARRGPTPGLMHAFDLTPSIIQRFRQTLATQNIGDVEIAEADVLALDALPQGWTNYDLIVSASMLEYVARGQLADALRGLRELLTPEGRLILFITRRNWVMRLFIGLWWRSNLYSADELREAFKLAGHSQVYFRGFPLTACYLTIWGHVIEAHK